MILREPGYLAPTGPTTEVTALWRHSWPLNAGTRSKSNVQGSMQLTAVLACAEKVDTTDPKRIFFFCLFT